MMLVIPIVVPGLVPSVAVASRGHRTTDNKIAIQWRQCCAARVLNVTHPHTECSTMLRDNRTNERSRVSTQYLLHLAVTALSLLTHSPVSCTLILSTSCCSSAQPPTPQSKASSVHFVSAQCFLLFIAIVQEPYIISGAHSPSSSFPGNNVWYHPITTFYGVKSQDVGAGEETQAVSTFSKMVAEEQEKCKIVS